MKWLYLALALLTLAALLVPSAGAIPTTPPRATDTPAALFEAPVPDGTPQPTADPYPAPYPAPARLAAAAPPLLVFAAAYCGTCDLRAGSTVQVVIAVYADNPITETLTLDAPIPAGLTLLRTRQNQPGVALEHPALIILDYRVTEDARDGLRALRYTAHAGASVGEAIAHVQIGRAVAPRLWLPLVAK